VFECPICHKRLPTIKAPNGIPRKTCGLRKCIKAMKYKAAAHADFYCKWCNQTKHIPFRPERKTCGERKCVEANANHNRHLRARAENPDMKKREKPKGIDLIPIEDLKKAAPTFYGLVRVNPMKERKCLKCGTIFKSLGYHTCSECRYQNAGYGVRASSL